MSASLTGREVHHTCGEKNCWAPHHLVALTAAEHGAAHAQMRREARMRREVA
jgi:hypothetical protein